MGQKYKYAVEQKNGRTVYKSDPYALLSECRPGTASVIYESGKYAWGDKEWMKQRAGKDWIHGPLNIYEVHLGSWKRGAISGIDYETQWQEVDKRKAEEPFLNYRELAEQLAVYLNRDALYACGNHARFGASSGCLLGLSDALLLFDYKPIWLAGRFPVFCGPPSSGGDRRHSGLGARSFLQG